MPITLRKMEPVNNVAQGAIATAKLGVDRAFHSAFFTVHHTKSGSSSVPMSIADMKTHIEELKLTLVDAATGNSTDIWEISGKNFLEWLKFYGYPEKGGILYLPFAQIHWDNPAEEAKFKLGTSDLRAVQISIKLGGSVVAPVIEGYASEYEYNEPLGRFLRLQENQTSNSVKGKLEITDLPIQGAGIGLKALHLTTDKVSDIEFRVDRDVIYEDVVLVRKFVQRVKSFRTQGRTHNTNWTHLDFAGNQTRNIFDTSSWRDIRLIPNMTAATTFTVISEMIVGIETPVGG